MQWFRRSGEPPGIGARRRRRRLRTSRRVRSLAAAGLVLGVGATSTLAAWTDQEVGAGTVTSGTFALVSAGANQEFAPSTSGSPRTLSFDVSSNLVPGSTSYSLFSVRTASGSVGGTLQFQGGTNTGNLAQHLRYSVRVVPSASCNASAFDSSSTTVVPSGSTLPTASTSAQTITGNGQSTVHYCIRLSLPSDTGNSAQGQSATPQFSITGTTAGT